MKSPEYASKAQMEYISRVSPTKEKMIEKISQYRNGEEVSPVWLDAYRYFNTNYDIGTRLDKYYSYTNVADNIDKEIIDKFFGEEFYDVPDKGDGHDVAHHQTHERMQGVAQR